jgi:glutathione S-transferase
LNYFPSEIVKILFEPDEVKKTEAKQAFVTTHSPKYLARLNTLQYENGGDFLVGQKMTWADIYIADKLQAFEETIDPAILNGYPHLRKVKDAVFSDPKIKAYIERRSY